MKTKNFSKKLALNKKTLVNLNPGLMGNIKGGEPPETTTYVGYCDPIPEPYSIDDTYCTRACSQFEWTCFTDC